MMDTLNQKFDAPINGLNQRAPWSAEEARAALEYFQRELRRHPTTTEFNAFVAGYRIAARSADRFG